MTQEVPIATKRIAYVRLREKAEYEQLYGPNTWDCPGATGYIVHDEHGRPICWGVNLWMALIHEECTELLVQRPH